MVNRDKFFNYLDKCLNDIPECANGINRIPLEKLILYLVDKVKTGRYRGTISIKISDNDIYSPREEVETQLNREYLFIEEEN